MTNKQQDQALLAALQAATAGAEVTLKYFRRLKKVSIKEGAGLVSEADRESEAAIIKCVRKKFPSFQILGEEGGFTQKPTHGAEGLWVVDPLDGTTNYVHGFPFFCISIGLEINGVIEIAVIYAPLLKYLYTAQRGRGAFFNKKPMRVSETDQLEQSLLATGFSYQADKILEAEIGDFRVFSEVARGVRRAGSAALDMCMVASGVFDGFWERELAPWDTAAGSLIVEEAGGKVTNFAGQPFHYSMKSVAAGNPHIHEKILSVIQRR